jgi:hypothetical protein
LILDFEDETITFDTECQKGTEYYKGLRKKKEEILNVIGYEAIDITAYIRAFNDFANGIISEEELEQILDEFQKE